jgi:hypothetical protein
VTETLVGLNENVMPVADGGIAAERLTVPEKPLMLASEIVEVAVAPGVIEGGDGLLAWMLKSGSGVTIRLNLPELPE